MLFDECLVSLNTILHSLNKKEQGNPKQPLKDTEVFYLLPLSLTLYILAPFSPHYLWEKPYSKIAALL